MYRRARSFCVGAAIGMLLPALVAITTAQATSGGSPYDNPIAVDVNPAPDVFETTLVAQARTVDIGNGVMANAFTYNGTIPGPQIRVKQGDTVIVHFTNQLPPGENTGIHWHGIELDNQSDGTPISQDHLHPGDTFLYKFEVPRPGIYWYHPHMHTSTNQAFRGLYGAIYVTDPNEPALIGTGVLPPASQTRTMVLSDTTVCKTPGTNDAQTYPLASPWAGNAGGGPPLPAFQPPPTPVGLCETSPINNDGSPRGPFAAGDIPNIQTAANGRTNEGQTVLTNGKNVGARAGTPAAPGALAPGASVLNVTPGQGLRLQFVNASTVRFFRLILTTNTGVQIPLVRIGDDNGL
ncbi:MAG: multicopper oxidase family protein, partial [Acidimicrobiia bacterium]